MRLSMHVIWGGLDAEEILKNESCVCLFSNKMF